MKTICKTTLAIVLGIVVSINLHAQRDTTKINFGNQHLTIISSSSEDEIKALEEDILKFEENIKLHEEELQRLEVRMQNITDPTEIDSLKTEMEDLKRRVNAYRNGIDDMKSEMDELKENETRKDFTHSDKKQDNHCKDTHFDMHWAGFEFGLNNFLNNEYLMQLPQGGEFMELNTGRSWAFALNLFEYDFPIVKDKLGIGTGMGIDWNNYHFEKNITLSKDENDVIYGRVLDIDLDKNTLNTAYLTVPLIMEIQMGKFFINGGITGSLKINSKTKQYYQGEFDYQKRKVKGDYQLNSLRYGLTARIGYQNVRLFANYSMVPLFEKGKGPEIYPFTVGLTIIDF